jgi:photosystem II stability/assembly factor-like uncharacterized protein
MRRSKRQLFAIGAVLLYIKLRSVLTSPDPEAAMSRAVTLRQLRHTLIALVTLVAALTCGAQRAAAQWSLEEAQPEVPNGGRANTIALSGNVILVASETGGLFRSADSGVTWHHVDSLPEYVTPAVRFLSANPDIAIATVEADYRVANGGGIWRSADRGLTWAQVYSPASPYGTPDRFTAREISVAADTGAIYVATSFGVSISNDQGLTWRLVDPLGAPAHDIIAVLAQPGGLVLAGGPAGFRRSTDAGTTWTAPTTNIGALWDLHALGGSPLSASQVYVVDGMTNLWASNDGGDHWIQLTAAPAGGGTCGGIGFVKAITRRLLHGAGLKLYFGNRCYPSWLIPPRISGTDQFDLTGAWTAMTVDHGDTRDIAFGSSNQPVLLASDGGLHKTTDGGATWTFTGGGSAGYNALQITETTSQRTGNGSQLDLYYATQDNDVRATLGVDNTWPAIVCCEGFYIELQHQVASDADSQVTFGACLNPCHRFLTGRRFASLVDWPNAPGAGLEPKIVGESFHVQAVGDSTSLNPGLAVTRDLGGTWSQYGEFNESVRAIPKLSRTPTSPFVLPQTVLYQGINIDFDWTRGFEIDRLVRTEQGLAGTLTVTYPRMFNFGGLGINRTMFAWYQVFAVDPRDPNHLFAPDIFDDRMKETWDGGDTWFDRSDLTALVTGSGTFLFHDSLFPQASAISFSEDDPHMVAVGTMQGGLFLSSDRGTTWDNVYGSDRATYITSIHWISPLSAMVSTYGRGLWSLTRIFKVPPVWKYCLAPCHIFKIPRDREDFVDPSWDPVPERLHRSIVVLDGRILGARVTKGTLTDLYITAGSGVIWRSKADVPQLAVRTSSKWQGFQGMGRMRRLRTDEPIVGLALNTKNFPIGAITSARTLRSDGLLPATAAQEKPGSKPSEIGSRQSPTAGKPKISIDGAGEANRVIAGAPMTVMARALPPGLPVTVQIDGQIVASAKAADNGSLRAILKAPAQFGLHSITLVAVDRKGITGMNFLVVHSDEQEPRR